MCFVKKLSGRAFEFPSRVRIIVCCDYDETYMPFSPADKHRGGIRDLEDFVSKNYENLSLIIGWVTGSSIDCVLRKSDGYVSHLPHFIASSLGTEFYWLRGDELYESGEWNKRMSASGFRRENLGELVKRLDSSPVRLDPQSSDYKGRNMESYFYPASERIREDFLIMEAMARELGMKTEFTRCNPAAGDPPDSYDVAFMPHSCGKEEAVLFLAERFGLPTANIWAFGDSFNDFGMLHAAGNSFLVANADPEAKKHFRNHLEHDYCKGIARKLAEVTNI